MDPSQMELACNIDGSLHQKGEEAGLILVMLEEYNLHLSLRFNFKTFNNEAEYEALITGLKLAIALGA